MTNRCIACHQSILKSTGKTIRKQSQARHICGFCWKKHAEAFRTAGWLLA